MEENEERSDDDAKPNQPSIDMFPLCLVCSGPAVIGMDAVQYIHVHQRQRASTAGTSVIIS